MNTDKEQAVSDLANALTYAIYNLSRKRVTSDQRIQSEDELREAFKRLVREL
jgi:hypothetical protein